MLIQQEKTIIRDIIGLMLNKIIVLLEAKMGNKYMIIAKYYDSKAWDKSWSGKWLICWVFWTLVFRFKYDIVTSDFRK